MKSAFTAGSNKRTGSITDSRILLTEVRQLLFSCGVAYQLPKLMHRQLGDGGSV
jgi:hypothetical protein